MYKKLLLLSFSFIGFINCSNNTNVNPSYRLSYHYGSRIKLNDSNKENKRIGMINEIYTKDINEINSKNVFNCDDFENLKDDNERVKYLRNNGFILDEENNFFCKLVERKSSNGNPESIFISIAYHPTLESKFGFISLESPAQDVFKSWYNRHTKSSWNWKKIIGLSGVFGVIGLMVWKYLSSKKEKETGEKAAA